jgi:hypothetical protein
LSWADAYSFGQPVKVFYRGGWQLAQVCATRSSSCMVTLAISGGPLTANIHDPRNIKPCQPKSTKEPSTSSDQLSFD